LRVNQHTGAGELQREGRGRKGEVGIQERVREEEERGKGRRGGYPGARVNQHQAGEQQQRGPTEERR
jgi:hypothetical protein